MSNIYTLKLGESLSLSNYCEMTRVPGGWIFAQWSSNDEAVSRLATSFVPFNDEFMSESARGKDDG